MDRDAFIEMYPQVFHMASDGSWPSIEDHGLLSTAALVSLIALWLLKRQPITD